MSFKLSLAPLALASTFIASTSPAQAQLLINPEGGTVLSSAGQSSNNFTGRALGFTGNYFGQPHSTVSVAVDGHLNFDPSPFAFTINLTNVARISPLQQNLWVYEGQTITEKVDPERYYSVTWELGATAWGHVFHQFQVVWFGANTTRFGFRFLRDDIVFCYESVGASPWEAFVGLGRENGTPVPIPGDTDGHMVDADRAILPIFPESGKMILFRPTGTGSYTAHIIPCDADFNKSGSTSVQDLFDFLSAYFAGCP